MIIKNHKVLGEEYLGDKPKIKIWEYPLYAAAATAIGFAGIVGIGFVSEIPNIIKDWDKVGENSVEKNTTSLEIMVKDPCEFSTDTVAYQINGTSVSDYLNKNYKRDQTK